MAGEPALSLPRAPQGQSFEPGRYHPQTTTTDLFAAGAVQIADQVRNRAQSPLTIARLVLDRIEANRHLNAFITVDRCPVKV